MAQKSADRKVSQLIPKKFSLKDHLNVPDEAERFQLPAERVAELADEVEREGPNILISLRLREHELREKFREIYNFEVANRRECQFTWADGSRCGTRFASIEHAIAHIRWHLINQNEDLKTSRAAMNDVEAQLYTTIEKELQAALPAGERREIVKKLNARRAMLVASLREHQQDADDGEGEEEAS